MQVDRGFKPKTASSPRWNPILSGFRSSVLLESVRGLKIWGFLATYGDTVRGDWGLKRSCSPTIHLRGRIQE